MVLIFLMNKLEQLWNLLRVTINSSDLLTYLTIVLAFFAYKHVVQKDINTTELLLESLKDELVPKKIGEWIGGEYPQGTYKQKRSFLPSIEWVPIPFGSIKELIKRGVGGNNLLSSQLWKNLLLLNEKIELYNLYVEEEHRLIESNPQNNKELFEEINKLVEAKDTDVTFEMLQSSIEKFKKTDKEQLYKLATILHKYRKIRHEKLIADHTKEDGLNYLYKTIAEDIERILKTQSYKPLFIRMNQLFLFLTSIVVFLVIEYFLKPIL